MNNKPTSLIILHDAINNLDLAACGLDFCITQKLFEQELDILFSTLPICLEAQTDDSPLIDKLTILKDLGVREFLTLESSSQYKDLRFMQISSAQYRKLTHHHRVFTF